VGDQALLLAAFQLPLGNSDSAPQPTVLHRVAGLADELEQLVARGKAGALHLLAHKSEIPQRWADGLLDSLCLPVLDFRHGSLRRAIEKIQSTKWEHPMRRLPFGPRLLKRVEKYGNFHRTPINRALHFAGIPLLGIASLGLLCRASLPLGIGTPALEPNLAWPALVFAAAWYLWIDGAASLFALAVVVLCYAIGSVLPIGVLLGMFTAGTVLHFIGHFGFEGKPPATFSDLRSVLDAPAWLVFVLVGEA
jgi:uncharacterized membrane protein YGL010W